MTMDDLPTWVNVVLGLVVVIVASPFMPYQKGRYYKPKRRR